MFENIFKGVSFIKESFSFIMKDADVIKPSFIPYFLTGMIAFLKSGNIKNA